MTMRGPRDELPSEVGTRCALDLLRYFYRHSPIYVTKDALSMRTGYGAAYVQAGIDELTRVGVTDQHRHGRLGGVLYRLVVPQLSPGTASIASTSRWRRQTLLMAEARVRCSRAAMRAARSDERLARTQALLAEICTARHVARDG